MTNHPPAEIQALIENHINAFNTQDGKLFHQVFSETAIVIDGIAPYRWLNPNAPAKWLADVAKWREAFGVTHEHLAYEMGFWNRGLKRLRCHIGSSYRRHQWAVRR